MYNAPFPRPNLFGRIFESAKSLNFSSFLDGTQKTLGVINQAIPIIYQVKPMFQNAKTMFRIADEIRKPTSNNNSIMQSNTNNSNNTISATRPIFYI